MRRKIMRLVLFVGVLAVISMASTVIGLAKDPIAEISPNPNDYSSTAALKIYDDSEFLSILEGIKHTNPGDPDHYTVTIHSGKIATINNDLSVAKNSSSPVSILFTSENGSGGLDIANAKILAGGPTVFNNLTVTSTTGSILYGNGHAIKLGVNVKDDNGQLCFETIFGGATNSAVTSTDITILSGIVQNVYGGGDDGSQVTSDVSIKLSGSNTLCTNNIYGGGYRDTIHGNVSISVTDGANVNGSIFAGGHTADDSESKAYVNDDVAINVTGGSKVKEIFASVCGNGSIGKASETVTTTVNVTDSTILKRISGPGAYYGNAPVYGDIVMNIQNALVGELGSTMAAIQGTCSSTVSGNVTVNFKNSTANNSIIGGLNGSVGGNVYTTLENSVVMKSVYGGGLSSGAIISGNTTVKIVDEFTLKNIKGTLSEKGLEGTVLGTSTLILPEERKNNSSSRGDRGSIEKKKEEVKQPESVIKVPIGNNVLDVNGKTIVMDTAAYIDPETQRTMLPLRFLAQALGLPDESISWDSNEKQATIVNNETGEILIFTIGQNAVVVIDKYGEERTVTIDSAPVIKDSRTFIPLRAISELMGYEVNWDPVTKTVTIIID